MMRMTQIKNLLYFEDSNFNNNDYSYEELKIINKNILSLNYENIKIKKYLIK